MSSKIQLNDYNKRLKKQVLELTKKLDECSKKLWTALNTIDDYKIALEESKRKQRKWYHFY